MAPAKINLLLDVLGRRSDGYHDIHSLVAPISLCDHLDITPVASGVEAVVRPVGLPDRSQALAIDPAQNLAGQAAKRFFSATGMPGGCRIVIRKRIPVGAGLGGGSADAAATLRGLNSLFGHPMDDAALLALGSDIGCDVPPLLAGGPVWMAGRGETIQPITYPEAERIRPFWMVLLNPGFAVPTADIYRRWIPGLTLSPEDYKKTESVFISGDVQGLAGCLRNGLQQAAFAKYPVLQLLAGALHDAGACGVLLAGSGGTVFGLATSRRDAVGIRRRALDHLDATVWSRIVKTMPDGVMVAHGPLEARV